jgi:DnaD/phage-associated family protein
MSNVSKIFHGFSDRKGQSTPLPPQFFSELLPEMDHLGELKVLLYAIWRLNRLEGRFRYLRQEDFLADERFLQSLSAHVSERQAALEEALERLVVRGVLLRVAALPEKSKEYFYFLNSPKGRAAVKAIQQGKWRPVEMPAMPLTIDQERPNIFRLYEEHLGPLTPMIAETLRDAEQTYPPDWLEDAIRIAVENNVRRWRYVEAILRSWKEKGRDEQDRQGTEKDRRRYVEGEFADYIEH